MPEQKNVQEFSTVELQAVGFTEQEKIKQAEINLNAIRQELSNRAGVNGESPKKEEESNKYEKDIRK